MRISRFDSRHLLATTRLAGDDFVLLTAMPGYSSWAGRSRKFRPDAANIEYIQKNWPDADWEPEADAIRQALAQKRATSKEIAKKKKIKDNQFSTDFQFKTKPYDHQVKAFMLSRDLPAFALLMEQGTGKTKVSLDTAAYNAQLGRIDALIVIAPNGVHRNWIRNEVPAHFPDWIEYEAWSYSTDHSKRNLRERDRVLSSDKFKIIAINAEGFSSNHAQKLLESCLKQFRCMVVIDESSRIKNPSAMRTKFLIQVCRSATIRRILSGTPVTKGIENLYSQFKFLDPDIIGYDTFTGFKRQYCITRLVNYGEMIVGYKNQAELIERIDEYSYRCLKVDCLDLPPKVYKSFPVELTARQSEMYNSLVRDFITQIGDGELMTAELAVTRLLRLQQIICGWAKTDSGNVVEIDSDNPRLKALHSVLEDIEGKVVIWARFVSDLDLIASSLGKDAIRYRGDIEDVARFQSDEGARYFVANPASAGLGLTLTAAETVIYYSNSFDLEHRQQSEDRTHRIGTKNSVTYIDLIADGTIDVHIVDSLRGKKLISDSVLQDPESFFMEYQDA